MKCWVKTVVLLFIPIVVIFPCQMILTYLFDNFVDVGFSDGVTQWTVFVLRWGYPFLQMLVTLLPICWVLTTSTHDNTMQNILSYFIPLGYLVVIILFFYSFRGVSRVVGSIQIPMALLVPYIIKLICITKTK